MFERYLFFSIIVCCFVVTRRSKDVFWANRNGGGAQAVIREGTAPYAPPP